MQHSVAQQSASTLQLTLNGSTKKSARFAVYQSVLAVPAYWQSLQPNTNPTLHSRDGSNPEAATGLATESAVEVADPSIALRQYAVFDSPPNFAERLDRTMHSRCWLRRELEHLAQFAEQLSLLNRIDTQICFQVSIQLDDLRWITSLLDNKVDQELRQLRLGKRQLI